MSSSGIQLIVGLGNPGAEYENTRHNAGTWFVEYLAKSSNVSLLNAPKFRGFQATAKLHDYPFYLFIPTTFMNLSGQAVKAFVNFYKIPTHAILIAHDDIDLEVGDIRIKFSGGHGGHNGLRDIVKNLNSPDFYRLRIGVGRPQDNKEVVDYVLKQPNKSDKKIIDHILHDALQIIPELLAGHFQKAMQTLHTK